MRTLINRALSLVALLGFAALFLSMPVAHLSDISVDWPTITDDDGTGTSGTAINAALFDAIETAINNQVYSSTNPTITPKAIIDEVKTARGGQANLNTRLNLLATTSTTPTLTQIQNALGATNLVTNGNMDSWLNGTTSAPDGWTLATVTIVKAGSGQSDTTQLGSGPFCAKLTRAGANGTLSQDIISTANFTNYQLLRGQYVTISMEAKTSTSSQVRLTIDDGIGTESTSYHTGSGTVQLLSKAHLMASASSKLTVYVSLESSDGSVYVGGVQAYVSDLEPLQWHYNTPITPALVPYRLLESLNTTVSNGTTVETDLHTYSLPASTLAYNTQILRITSTGTTAASGNAKTARVYFGATVCAVVASSTNASGRGWRMVVEVTRLTATTQRCTGQAINTDQAGTSAVTTLANSSLGETLSGAVAIKVTGTGGASTELSTALTTVELLTKG